ncbi:DUF952 domain-containing protein [Lapillicoccus sp.]|uniref:DUF952 domain-containing protein n=1 Tax=Lapillicoccus sp. TaxID=1909287 RepID=UPI0025D76816|nr:DUF952 domain-containing protein [Lapillicoccus sp.]
MTTPIFHLAEPQAWTEAGASGLYAVSTRGRTLAQEGFIHCSEAAQWPVVRRSFYADVETDLVLLEIDPTRLSAPVVREVGNPATGEEFPHVYGPIEVSAVVATAVLAPPHA